MGDTMNETRYIISDAAKELKVEPHVLRYWEDELSLSIPRNDMGHRFYRENDMNTFRTIIRLKEHGFHLRAIKLLMPDIHKLKKFDDAQLTELRYELEERTTLPAATSLSPQVTPSVKSAPFMSPSDKMEQFRLILTRIVTDALKESEKNMTSQISTQVSTQVTKEMDYLFRQKEEADEERYRTLDETIRNFQQARRMAAINTGRDLSPRKRHKKGILPSK